MGIPVLIRCECGAMANVRQFPLYCCCGRVYREQAAGLGDFVAAFLKCVGVTRTRYILLKRWLGLAPQCKCPQRQEKLNTIGKWIGRILTWRPW